MDKVSEEIRTKGGIFTAYEWEIWRQETADEVAQLEVALKKIVNLGDNAGDWTEAMYEIAVEALEARD